MTEIDRSLPPAEGVKPSEPMTAAPTSRVAHEGVAASDFRALAEAHAQTQMELRAHADETSRRLRDQLVAELLEAALPDAQWRGLIAASKQRAAQGATQHMLIRFPAALCEDGGRAVNVPGPDWPATLRGKPALLYRRWRNELESSGFRLTAQIVSFPDGLPGDIEMSLVWG